MPGIITPVVGRGDVPKIIIMPKIKTSNAKIIRRKQRSSRSQNKPATPIPKTLTLPSKSMVEKVCSVNDPFCKSAIGAKYFETGKVRTLSYSQHYRTVIATDSNGNGAVLVLPAYARYPCVGSMVGTAASFTNIYGSPAITEATVKSYRIVSYGIIVRGTATPMTASGMVRVRTFDAVNGSTFATIQVESYNCAEYEDIPLSRCTEVAIQGKRLDDTSSFLKPTTDTISGVLVADWKSPGFSSILIAVTGGPASTSPVDLEVFFNYELTFADDDGMAQIATHSPPALPMIKEAAELVSSETKAIFKNGMKALAQNTLKSAANALLQAGAAYFLKVPPSITKAMITGPVTEVD